MGNTKKMFAALEAVIKHARKEDQAEEIGPILTAVLIDFARHVGMPRDVLVPMIIAVWDELDANEAKAEMH